MKDPEFINEIERLTEQALKELAENGHVSEESGRALDTAMATMITQAIEVNKDLGIIPKEDVVKIKRSRAFLMENPGKGSEDIYGAETARIMFTYLNMLSILNEEEDE